MSATKSPDEDASTALTKVDLAAAQTFLRTDEEVTELARDCLLGRTIVTQDPDALRYGFGLLLSALDIDDDAAEVLVACVGEMDRTIGGDRGINGWPMFGKIGFLHRDNTARFNDELERMSEALGMASPTAPPHSIS